MVEKELVVIRKVLVCDTCGLPDDASVFREVDPYPCPVCGENTCNYCQAHLRMPLNTPEKNKTISQFDGRICKKHLTDKRLVERLKVDG